MLIRIFSPTECELIRDADLKKCELIRDANLKKCGLNRMTTVLGNGTNDSYDMSLRTR
jgi:hypothetical protein